MKTIGCIGLGLLGSAIARRLLQSGYRVIGTDIDAARIAGLAGSGIEIAPSPAALVAQCDLVTICVTSTASVEAVIASEGGLLTAGRREGLVIVDHSTTGIDPTRRLAQRLQAECGMGFVDAPVSGGPDAALAGRLSLMAGGSGADTDAVREVMQCLGRFTVMGAVGAGQATKLVNQTLVLPTYCLMAEAFRLAQAYGVDTRQIPQALELGHAGSNLLPVLFQRMNDQDFEPRGYARQVLKDLEMLHDASRAGHLAMPMTSQALSLFRMLVAGGGSELDGAAVLTVLPDPTTAGRA